MEALTKNRLPAWKTLIEECHPILASLLFIAIITCAIIQNQCKGVQVLPKARFANELHFGKWIGKDDSGRIGKISFYRSGLASFVVGEHHFGGSTMTPKGALLYQIDYSSTPIHLDLIGVDASYKELRRIRFIVKFTSKERLHACTFMNEVRPKSFATNNKDCYKIVFRKIKEK